LPSIKEINSGVVQEALRRSDGRDRYDGSIRDDQGRDFLFRVTKFDLGGQFNAHILLLAAQEDFAQNVRNLQFTGLILAIIASAAFIPVIWIFGGGMSRSLRDITAQAIKLQTLAAPGPSSVMSRIKEVHELGGAMELAQRAIWSFAHFVPKEIVQRIVDNSISTELGGAREEITVVGTLPAPEVADGASDAERAAAADGRARHFREETRDHRIGIAREAEHRFDRKVAWGVEVDGRRLLFTHLAVPVMTRLRQPERLVLDTLVAAGVARSRSEALAWSVRLVGKNAEPWLGELRQAMERVERVREQGPDRAQD